MTRFLWVAVCLNGIFMLSEIVAELEDDDWFGLLRGIICVAVIVCSGLLVLEKEDE